MLTQVNLLVKALHQVMGTFFDNSEYGIISLVDNDISNGILNFGKTYTYMEEFRNSGEAEESGTIGVIGFKVLSEESTNIRFENQYNAKQHFRYIPL